MSGIAPKNLGTGSMRTVAALSPLPIQNWANSGSAANAGITENVSADIE
jgi:hypothetical protein